MSLIKMLNRRRVLINQNQLGFISYKKFNGNAIDSINSQYDGVETNVTYGVGVSGQCAVFTGDGSVSVAADSGLELTEGTISCLIKASSSGGYYRGIIILVSSYNIYLKYGVFGTYSWAAPFGWNPTSHNLNDGNWHSVGMTFKSGVTNATILYLDGIPVLTTTWSTTVNSSLLQTGKGTDAQKINASIEGQGIWNRILTADEMLANHIIQINGGDLI